LGTQIRPSLRSDSDISVSFDWKSSLWRDAGRVDLRVAGVGEVGALAVRPPRAVTLQPMALVERKKTLP
jgi:hypothetical protein